jgi:K+-transporting ATPase c subunit
MPLAVGFAVFIFVLGFVFARWMMLLGTMALVASVAGLLFEYYRGEFVK